MPIDQQKLDKEYIFSSRGTAAELAVEMDRIDGLERKFEFRISFIRWLAFGVFLLFAAGASALGGFMVVLGVLAAIGLLIYSWVVKATAIVHERVEFPRLTLKTLSQDAGQKGRFRVLLRLRNPRYPGGKESFLRDSWLSLNGRLSDGTSISESCTDLIRRRTKKNGRGKTKIKVRRACLLRIQLDYNPERYGDASAALRAIENPFRLPNGAQMKAFHSGGKALAMKAIVKGNPASGALHAVSQALLLGAYRVLNFARTHAIANGGAQ